MYPSHLFDADACGVQRLLDNLSLSIQGTAVTPSVVYIGGDAAAGGWIAHGGYGTTLSLAGAGASPTYDRATPFWGSNDLACKFAGAKYFQAGTATTGDLTTEDFVIEVVLRSSNAAQYFLSKLQFAPSAQGYELYRGSSGGVFGLNLYVAGVGVVCSTSAVDDFTWCRLFFACNRDENSTNGTYYAVNLSQGGLVNPINAVNSATSTAALVIGARSSYAAVWMQADWFDGVTDQADWAAADKERHALLHGRYPVLSRGTAVPEVVS
jgi:hypothetical protein